MPPTDATDVTAAEQQKVIQAKKGVRYDQVVKVVDIGKYNIAVAVTHHESPTPNAGTHSGITELYIVTSGSGVLTTGGTIPGAKPGNGNALPTGPGGGGPAIVGGRSRKMVAGDIAIIPPNVPHSWTEVDPPLNVLVGARRRRTRAARRLRKSRAEISRHRQAASGGHTRRVARGRRKMHSASDAAAMPSR